MERERIIYLFLLFVLILVFSSCHPRHVSDIKPNMTKEEVVSLWGRTDLISFRTVNGKAVETWEYHFSNTNSICWVTFSQDRVVATQCRPLRGGYRYPYPHYPYYYPYP
jgi:hypothetical protein